MVPPADHPPKDGQSPIPLREWVTRASFDSAQECEGAKGDAIRQEFDFQQLQMRDVMKAMKDRNADAEKFFRETIRHSKVAEERLAASLCIASDDRRLNPPDPRAPRGEVSQ